MVGGVDADIVIDGTLIDIKTTKNFEFNRDFFNQLIGYYVLSKIGGLEGLADNDIKSLGIYYSRFATTYRFDSECIEKSQDFPAFVDWFTEKAKDVGYNQV